MFDKNHIHNHIIFNSPASLTIASTFPTNAAIIKSAALAIASARKMDLPPVCQQKKKEKVIKIWNIIVEQAGKQNCVLL